MNPRIVWLSSILIAGASAATPPVITGASPDIPDIAGGEQALEVTVGDVAANATVVSVAEYR